MMDGIDCHEDTRRYALSNFDILDELKSYLGSWAHHVKRLFNLGEFSKKKGRNGGMRPEEQLSATRQNRC